MTQTVQSIHINASAERVYDVITNFDNYKDWNPWLTEAKGNAQTGSIVTATMRWQNGSTRQITHRVTTAVKPCIFEWRAESWYSPIINGGRRRDIIRDADGKGVTLQVTEIFEGALKKPVRWWFGESLSNSLAEELQAIKAEAENTAPTRRSQSSDALSTPTHKNYGTINT